MKRFHLPKITVLALWACMALPTAFAQSQDPSAFDGLKVKDAILQDVQKQGFDKQAEVQAALKAAQETVLLRAWEQLTLKANPVTSAQRDAAYKDLLNMLGKNEYRMYHLTLADQEQAKGLIQRLQSGLAWDKVELTAPGNPEAKVTATKTDWVNLAVVMPEFREAVKLLKPGQVYPTPVKSNAGWHVLGLVETRDIKAPSAEQVKSNLEKMAEKKIIRDKVLSLINR